MNEYQCTFPGCDATFPVTEHFGPARARWNEHGELVGWAHETEIEHATPIDPAYMLHVFQAHPRDIEATQARTARLVDETMAVHDEWFPEDDEQ